MDSFKTLAALILRGVCRNEYLMLENSQRIHIIYERHYTTPEDPSKSCRRGRYRIDDKRRS